MTAYVIPDLASPCFGVQHWPQRPARATLEVEYFDDNQVTVIATPLDGDGPAVTKTVQVADHTAVKGRPAPPGGLLRWRCADTAGPDVVFTSRQRADARAYRDERSYS